MVPISELRIDFSRSGGPGGQNVNKTSTKVTLRWSVAASRAFSPEQKNQIRAFLRNRINKEDELVLSVETERSQSQNRELAIERLNTLVKKALVRKKIRRPTKPTRASKIKRLEYKRKVAHRKRARRGIE